MTESAADIQKYLNVIEGDFGNKQKVQEGQSIDLGISTGGADIGSRYLFENGLRWLEILQESNQFWVVEHGYIEHDADTQELLSKYDLTRMINLGEMMLDDIQSDDLLLESSIDSEFNIFMEKVDKYLLVNYQMDSQHFNFDWRVLFEDGLTPTQAAEWVILEE